MLGGGEWFWPSLVCQPRQTDARHSIKVILCFFLTRVSFLLVEVSLPSAVSDWDTSKRIYKATLYTCQNGILLIYTLCRELRTPGPTPGKEHWWKKLWGTHKELLLTVGFLEVADLFVLDSTVYETRRRRWKIIYKNLNIYTGKKTVPSNFMKAVNISWPREGSNEIEGNGKSF